MHRFILPLVGILAGLVLAPSAVAAQGGTGCQLAGTATTSQPLTMAGITFTFAFGGTLSQCTGSFPETSATISAGKKITIGGVDYQPISVPAATGGCQGVSTINTKLFVQWNNGKFSLLQFNSTAGVIAPLISANFQPNTVTLQRVTPDPLDPKHTSDTFPLTYAGNSVGGLFLMTPDLALCTAAGSTSVPVTGALAHGNTQ